VLPACMPEALCGADGGKLSSGGKVAVTGCQIWESPVLVSPLANENGITAHVALKFAVTADPAMLLRLARDSELPLSEKVGRLIKCNGECTESQMHECSLPEKPLRQIGQPFPICKVVRMQGGQPLNLVSNYRATDDAAVDDERDEIVGLGGMLVNARKK